MFIILEGVQMEDGAYIPLCITSWMKLPLPYSNQNASRSRSDRLSPNRTSKSGRGQTLGAGFECLVGGRHWASGGECLVKSRH